MVSMLRGSTHVLGIWLACLGRVLICAGYMVSMLRESTHMVSMLKESTHMCWVYG